MRSLDFYEELRWSHSTDDVPWLEFYAAVWPNMINSVELDAKSVWQRRGVDRIVYLEDGRQFAIDEKKRRKDYGDFLIEVWSVCDRAEDGSVINKRARGWGIDAGKVCDFVAYSVPGMIRLIPQEAMRLTMERFGREWCRDPARYPKWSSTRSGSRSWSTASVAVPWGEFWQAMGSALSFVDSEAG